MGELIIQAKRDLVPGRFRRAVVKALGLCLTGLLGSPGLQAAAAAGEPLLLLDQSLEPNAPRSYLHPQRLHASAEARGRVTPVTRRCSISTAPGASLAAATAAPVLQVWPGLSQPVFSPDGRLMLARGGDGQLRLFEVTNHLCLRSFPGVHGAFSGDGRHLASVAERQAQVRPFPFLASSFTIRLADGPSLIQCALSADGRWLAVAAADTAGTSVAASELTISTFDLAAPAARSHFRLDRLEGGDPTLAELVLVFNATGGRLYVDWGAGPACFDTRTGTRLSLKGLLPHTAYWLQPQTPSPRIVMDQALIPTPIALNPAAQESADERVRCRLTVFDPESAQAVRVIQYACEAALAEEIELIRLSPDLRHVAENYFWRGKWPVNPRLYDTVSGEGRELNLAVDEEVLGFDPRGRWVVTGWPDGRGGLTLDSLGAETPLDFMAGAEPGIARREHLPPGPAGRPPGRTDHRALTNLLARCHLLDSADERVFKDTEWRAESADGRWVLATKADVMFLLDLRRQAVRRLGPQEALWSHQGGGSMGLRGIVACAFTPDGSKLVVWGDIKVGLRAYSVVAGAPIYTHRELQVSGSWDGGGVLTMSPDNVRVAASDASSAWLVNLATRKCARLAEEPVDALAFTPEGDQLLVVQEDTLRWWEIKRARYVKAIRNDLFRGATGLECLQGATLLSLEGGDGGRRLVSLRDPLQPRELGRQYRVGGEPVVFSADGRYDCKQRAAIDKLLGYPSAAKPYGLLPASARLRQEPGLYRKLVDGQ